MFLIFNNRLLPRLRFHVDDSDTDLLGESDIIHSKKLISERLRIENRSSFIKVHNSFDPRIMV